MSRKTALPSYLYALKYSVPPTALCTIPNSLALRKELLLKGAEAFFRSSVRWFLVACSLARSRSRTGDHKQRHFLCVRVFLAPLAAAPHSLRSLLFGSVGRYVRVPPCHFLRQPASQPARRRLKNAKTSKAAGFRVAINIGQHISLVPFLQQ